MAKQVVVDLQAAWDFETTTLGFEPPLPDAGECGPDERFDVFIWRGKVTCFVQIMHEGLEDKYLFSPQAPWGGRTAYMVVDPWGKYGGKILGQTMAHELNHASHAREDYYEAGDVFEMSATYVEQYFNKALAYNVAAFQNNPDWALLFYDDYATYYMYGSALYMYFLRDYYFSRQAVVDQQFPSRLWLYMRNSTARPQVNKPNVVDGLDRLLAPFGDSFLDSALVFARWRYYAGTDKSDGVHFKPWQGLPPDYTLMPFLPEAKIVPAKVTLADGGYKVDPPPMLTGNGYVEVTSDDSGQKSFQLSLDAPLNPAVRWVVQAVPGTSEGSDGETLDLSSGSARVAFAADGQRGKRTLIISAMPTTTLDPDDRSAERFPVTLKIKP